MGSNLGNKMSNLQQAVDFIKKTGRIITISSIYRTRPVDMDASADDFLNMALSVESVLEPQEMLQETKRIEREIGRPEGTARYVSRIIDIDILMANDDVVSLPNLTIPHPGMTKRAFVLVPLNEIGPQLIHPILKKKIGDILEEIQTTETVKKCTDKLIV